MRTNTIDATDVVIRHAFPSRRWFRSLNARTADSKRRALPNLRLEGRGYCLASVQIVTLYTEEELLGRQQGTQTFGSSLPRRTDHAGFRQVLIASIVDFHHAITVKAIRSSKIVAWPELGMEAIRELQVRDMPVTVAIDGASASVNDSGPRLWRGRHAPFRRA